MSKWQKLHIKTRVKGTDGFVMSKYVHPHTHESNLKLIQKLGQEVVTSNQFVAPIFLQRCFVKCLKDYCANGFCISYQVERRTEENNYEPAIGFFIGFRSKKDLFKFCMKFPAKRVRWWRSEMEFTVIGKQDDDYETKHAGDDWNREDYHGVIE